MRDVIGVIVLIGGVEKEYLKAKMEALGGGNGGFLGWGFPPRKPKQSKSQRRNVNSSESVDATGGTGFHFPLKQALTAGSLSLTGDTLAQLIDRWKRTKALKQNSASYSGDSEEVNSLASVFKILLVSNCCYT